MKKCAKLQPSAAASGVREPPDETECVEREWFCGGVPLLQEIVGTAAVFDGPAGQSALFAAHHEAERQQIFLVVKLEARSYHSVGPRLSAGRAEVARVELFSVGPAFERADKKSGAPSGMP